MTENTPNLDGAALEALKRQEEEKLSFAEAREDLNDKFKSPNTCICK